jgi:hypothetical protein
VAAFFDDRLMQESHAMSSVLAVPVPQSGMSLGQQWVGANILAQVICLATAGAAYGVARLIGADDPAAGASLKNIAYGLTLGTELVFAISVAALRGVVLRKVLPGFPLLLWIGVVLAYLMTLHFITGLSPASNTPVTVRTTTQMSAGLFVLGIGMTAFAGLIMGTIVGTIEALVIRRVSEAAAFWAMMTACAWSAAAVLAFVLGSLAMMQPGLSDTVIAIVGAVAKLAMGAMAGLITLPALKQLKPRQQAS